MRSGPELIATCVGTRRTAVASALSSLHIFTPASSTPMVALINQVSGIGLASGRPVTVPLKHLGWTHMAG